MFCLYLKLQMCCVISIDREVNRTITDKILKTVRDTIGSFSFKFDDPVKQARIISGAEEGLYSWVTVNYLTGKFGQVGYSNLSPWIV